jgi:hypothetical protein
LKLEGEEAKQVFAKLDSNGGGQILFDEFCAWLAINRVPVSIQSYAIVQSSSSATFSLRTLHTP